MEAHKVYNLFWLPLRQEEGCYEPKNEGDLAELEKVKQISFTKASGKECSSVESLILAH